MPAGRAVPIALAAACLVLGIAGGLARLGMAIPAARAAAWHGLLMTGGFLGTVISLERAVALGKPFAFAAPIAAAAGALASLLGLHVAAVALQLAAALILATVCAATLGRQRQQHIVLLLVAALAWAVAGVAMACARPIDAIATWWFAFLVLTIAAERLELTRLARRPPLAAALFHACIALLVAGAATSLVAPGAGGILFGAALIALAVWLLAFDIARHTVKTAELARYSAIALLTGYAWLAAAGAAWIAMSSGASSVRDAALHMLGLGFVFSMIFAHAPIILPAVARVRVRFHPSFYAPLVLLHLSVAVRAAGAVGGDALRRWGGILNVAAIALFAATLVAMARRPGR